MLIQFEMDCSVQYSSLDKQREEPDLPSDVCYELHSPPKYYVSEYSHFIKFLWALPPSLTPERRFVNKIPYKMTCSTLPSRYPLPSFANKEYWTSRACVYNLVRCRTNFFFFWIDQVSICDIIVSLSLWYLLFFWFWFCANWKEATRIYYNLAIICSKKLSGCAKEH